MNRSRVLQVSAGLLMACTMIRASAIAEPLPGWDIDPLSAVSAITGIGPTASLVIDALIVLAAAGVLLACRSGPGWLALVACIGGMSVIIRTLVLDAGNAEPLPLAGAWVSGAFACAAGMCIARRPAIRRYALAIMIGFVGILIAKSIGQRVFEHPDAVASFEADPVATLASQGFEPATASALQFERRLRQPDITGWFGLSNVLAAFFVAAFCSLGLLVWERRACLGSWAWVAAALACVSSGAGIVITGSKAGLAIATTVVCAVAAVRIVRRAPASLLGLAVWLLPVLAIVTRAASDFPREELSLLFRWFYLKTSGGIVLDHLPWGTGIDGYRTAYAMAKPAIAPETVTSSHNAIADWLAMLGVVALPLVAVVLAVVWRLGPALRQRARPLVVDSPSRAVWLAIGGTFAVPVVCSAMLESEATTSELALLRLVGLGLAVALAGAVWGLRPGRSVAAICALVLLTHGQIDMMLFLPASIPLALLVAGLACPSVPVGRARVPAFVLGVATTAGLAYLSVALWSWEHPLREAFHAAQQAPLAAQSVETPTPSDRVELSRLTMRAALSADESLERASAAMPGDARSRLAQSSVRGTIAGMVPRAGRSAWLERAYASATAAVEAEPSAATHGALGSLAAAIARDPSTPQSQAPKWTESARLAWTEAFVFDPHGPHFPARLAELESDAGHPDAAAEWAAIALAKHANYSLDPLAGLSDRRVRYLEELVNPGVGPP